MWVYVFSVLAAGANAASSVLQRKANKDQPAGHSLSPRLIVDLLHSPVWFAGVAGIVAGFLLQAAALRFGPLSVVQPILIIELPLTLVLAGIVFGQTMHAREWSGIAAMTAGLAGLLYFLGPSRGTSAGVPALTWILGVGVTVAVIGGHVTAAAYRRSRPLTAAALLGVATGIAFGLTAALMKAMTSAFAEHGFVAIFGIWQTYAMAVTGVLALFLLQSALREGPLVAAQPGFTIADPLVSVLWGVTVFGERVNGGIDLFLSGLCAVLLGWGVQRVARSPQLELALG